MPCSSGGFPSRWITVESTTWTAGCLRRRWIRMIFFCRRTTSLWLGTSGLAPSIAVDVTRINRALAEAASGAMSARAGLWARDHASSTGYTLTHKLLALVFQASARGEPALPARDRPLAEKVLAE